MFLVLEKKNRMRVGTGVVGWFTPVHSLSISSIAFSLSSLTSSQHCLNILQTFFVFFCNNPHDFSLNVIEVKLFLFSSLQVLQIMLNGNNIKNLLNLIPIIPSG